MVGRGPTCGGVGGETITGVETVFEMFVVAVAIVAGLLIANAVVSPRRSL
jgi:uncharacterized membrane protein YjjB (DUF3815 family)